MNFTKFSQCLRLGMSPETADDMGKLYKGDKSTQTTSSSRPAQEQQYNTLLKGSDSWLNQGGFDKNYGGTAGFDPTANLTPEQQAALQGSYGTGGDLQSMYNTQGASSLGNFLGEYDPSKTGLNSAIDAANNRLDWNYNTTVAPNVRQGATDAGQFGSTRHGIAEGVALSNLSQQKVDASANLAYQDQQAYNTNQLNALNNLSSITRGLNSGYGLQYDTGSIQQQQDQSEINGQLQRWAYENNVSLNDLLAYQQLVSGNMGGTETNKSKGGGGGSSTLGTIGTIGGAVVGGFFGGPAGAAAGATVGGAAGNAIG